MTTLADINQTLVDQGEKQERTVEAIESLVGRIADLVNFGGKGPDDQLDKLEDRREKAAEERRNRMAGMGKVVSVVKENSGLLAKLLGGGALLGLLYFSSQEFRNDINAIFAGAGKIIADAVLAALVGDPDPVAPLIPPPRGPRRTGGGLEQARLLREAQRQQQQRGPRTGSAGLEQARGLREAQTRAQQPQFRLTDLARASTRVAGIGTVVGAGLGLADEELIEKGLLTGERMFAGIAQGFGGLADLAINFATFDPRRIDEDQNTSDIAERVRNFFIRNAESRQQMDTAAYGAAKGSPEAAELVDQLLDKLEGGTPLTEQEIKIVKSIGMTRDIGRLNAALRNLTRLEQKNRSEIIAPADAPIPFLGRFFGKNNVESVPGSSGMNIMQATENLGGAPGGGATVIQQDNSTNTYIQGGGGSGGTSGGVVPLPSDINVQRLDILGNFGTGRLM